MSYITKLIPPHTRGQAFGTFMSASHRLSPVGARDVIIFWASQLPHIRQFSGKKNQQLENGCIGLEKGT